MRRPTPNNAGRKLLLACGLALPIALAMAPQAFAGIITPEAGGSPNADEINNLYKITLYVALVIFAGVEGTLVYACYKFRARRGAVPAQIHGNTSLEIGWTVGAAVILLILSVITFVKLDAIRTPPNSGANGLNLSSAIYATSETLLPPNGKTLHIKVNGQQYVWRYTYPGGKNPDKLDAPYSYEEMVVPTDTTVTLDINAQDVIHSWWIPQLGGKFQAVPGYTNHTWFKISKPGFYRGQCAFLCGRLHANMLAVVHAISPPEFEAWLAQRQKDLAAADAAAQVSRNNLSKLSGAAAVQNP
ncbi:MAG: cytochrome c oxidase subunit II [Solirubrobacteraceae bacterium]